MAVKLKTKLTAGLVFLFGVILLFGVLGTININLLSRDADLILKDNYNSIIYCNDMMKALETVDVHKDAIDKFEENLKKQELNITEPGEKDQTEEIRRNFEELKADPKDPSNYIEIRQSIIQVLDLNASAIYHKNIVAQETARNAKRWLAIIFTILIMVSFTFIFNLPGIISRPIQSLSDGIKEIANKNYSKRIYLKQKDELGDLAIAFNTMAEKLDLYEHSNLAKMQFEKSRIETIINQMRDGIIGLDAKKNILFLNEVAQKLMGLKESDTIGKYAPDIALKNDLMRKLLQTDADKKDLKIYLDDKEGFFNKDMLDVKNNQEVIGQVIVLRNITIFHELNEAKTNFIATVSHELKTPISSIKMSARLLTDERTGSLAEDQKQLINSIGDDAERLLKITSELINLAQVETGNIQFNLQTTPVKAIVEDALDAVQIQAQQKNISIKTTIAADTPQIYADKEKTTWVMINLLTNAIKYSFESSSIEITAGHKNGHVELLVRDHGRGIDEKYLARVFDRYFKVPGSQERSRTGLGLAISKEFIEAQGGKIWVNSQIGAGSEFGFSFDTGS
ncbi:MAG TPA: ATP-binding protein [Puia sp.]|jgi:signal transduction histidine kinase